MFIIYREKKLENFVFFYKKIWNFSGDKGICCILFLGCIIILWGEWIECIKICDGLG